MQNIVPATNFYRCQVQLDAPLLELQYDYNFEFGPSHLDGPFGVAKSDQYKLCVSYYLC